MTNMTLTDVREIWRDHGGAQHGPHTETWTLPEDNILAFTRALTAAQQRKWRVLTAVTPVSLKVRSLCERAGFDPEAHKDSELSWAYANMATSDPTTNGRNAGIVISALGAWLIDGYAQDQMTCKGRAEK